MKIGAIIQARYDSSRLPGKVLKNLPFDLEETVLSQIHNRLRKSKIIDEIIIATSDSLNDDIIVDNAIEKKYIYVRGSKDNVLERFVKVIDERELDIVIRITGDNPIVFVDILDQVIQQHINSEFDYTRNLNLPYGTSFEVVKATVLKDIYYKQSTTISDQEHVTSYIKNNREKFKIQEIDHKLEPIDFRFTIDYPSDYAAMNIVFQFLRNLDYNYDYQDLKEFIIENQWLAEINKNNLQKKQFSNVSSELDYVVKLLEKLDYQHALKVIQRYSSDI